MTLRRGSSIVTTFMSVRDMEEPFLLDFAERGGRGRRGPRPIDSVDVGLEIHER